MYVQSIGEQPGRLDHARIARPRPLAASAGARPGRTARAAGLAAVIVVILSLLLARGVQGRVDTGYETVVVRPGDTLWSIAETRYPSQDPRVKLEQIEQINHLAGPMLQPGQQLRVPAS